MIPGQVSFLDMAIKVGVVSVQGDFEKHLQKVAESGHEGCEVRSPEDLSGVTHLILPGGESTTVGLLLQRYGLGSALIDFANAGKPIWGTCMGMILMAAKIEKYDQYSLGLLDITVRRNAFGAQVHSFETPIVMAGMQEPVMGVFIRAPIVTEHSDSVEVLAAFEGQTVAVRQGNRVGTSFHPELAQGTAFLDWFLSLK